MFMVDSLHNSAARRLSTLALLLLGSSAYAAAAGKAVVSIPAATARDTVQLDAASSEVDYRNNTVNFHDIIITQGSARVAADQAHATGLNFENSTWVFTGNVRITMDGGKLRSRQANVEFRNQKISRATILGEPAEFEQPRKGSSEIARGHSASIVYDLLGGIVTLTGDAWLSDGRNEIKGRELVYNVKEQRVKAQTQAGDKERVRITIRPRDTVAPAPQTPPAAAPAAPHKP
jgi:lipopolysaccharide transport protein LptA